MKFIIAFIVLGIAAYIYNVRHLSSTCKSAGGTMVYNGKFYDCIIAKTEQPKTIK